MLKPLVYFVPGLGAIALLIFLLVKLYELFSLSWTRCSPYSAGSLQSSFAF